MYETVSIPLPDLVLDTGNARLGETQDSQQAVYTTLATQQGRRLITLAEDIITNGVDPTALPAVVSTGDRRKRYRVLEGNRRILTLKALDTPNIVSGALGATDQRRLVELARRYAESPVDAVTCILFDNEQEAYHWVELRHTGANEGAGLVEWDTNEKDRFRARHGGVKIRTPAGQIIDFLEELDGPTASKTRIVTTLKRLISTRSVRDALGIDIIDGEVLSRYPLPEVQKGLRRVVEDLRSQTIKVKDVYDVGDREAYIKQIPISELPDPTKASTKQAVLLTDLATNLPKGTSRKKPARKPRVIPRPRTRTTVIPNDCRISPDPPRMNAIYNELLNLNADTFPNAGVVLLRVFLELSVDHEIERSKLMTDATRTNTPLSKRLKTVADQMAFDGRITEQLKKAVHKVAASQHTIAASTVTFNQYVHNRFAYPQPSEVRTAWDELQPFLEQVWA